MILRPAVLADVPAVTTLEATTFGADAWSADSVRAELTGERRTAVVACDPDVVGYAVSLAAADVVDLQRIVVAPSHRRQGLGRRLLDAVAPEGRVLLEVGAGNTAARAFYAGKGFLEIARRRGYYRDGSDAVVMERQWST